MRVTEPAQHTVTRAKQEAIRLAVVFAVMLGCGAWSGCWQAGAGRESDPSPRWPSCGMPCG